MQVGVLLELLQLLAILLPLVVQRFQFGNLLLDVVLQVVVTIGLLQLSTQIAEPAFQQHACVVVAYHLFCNVAANILRVAEDGARATAFAQVGVEAVGTAGVGACLGQQRHDVGVLIGRTPRHVAQPFRADVITHGDFRATAQVQRRELARLLAAHQLFVDEPLERPAYALVAASVVAEVVGHRSGEITSLGQFGGLAAERVGATDSHQILALLFLCHSLCVCDVMLLSRSNRDAMNETVYRDKDRQGGGGMADTNLSGANGRCDDFHKKG